MSRLQLASVIVAAAVAACSDSGSKLGSPGTDGGTCVNGDVMLRACGNCGTQASTCMSGSWSAFGACAGEGVCAAGTQEASSCGSDLGLCQPGTTTRVCTAACTWEPWSACGGAYVGPTKEICGNGLDENCDGIADELCDSFAVSGQIVKLIASPDGSLVYALNAGAPSEVVVLDAATHAEVARITLPQSATDMDLSPNGQHLVVAHDVVHQISRIDLATQAVQMTKPVASDPYVIEVNDAGVVYYATYDQWADIRRVNANLDFASDTLLGSWATYAPDLELSPDGAFLYAGESAISGGNVMAYDVSAGGLTLAGQSTWDDGYGFSYPSRHLYLGPDGRRIYYAVHQLDAGDLAFTAGATGEDILAEDRAGTLAVASSAVFDASTLRQVGTLPRPATCATFASGDGELWYYHAPTGRVFWLPKASLGDASLGSRALPAEPLSAYLLTRLVRDPSRPRLYGLDATRNLVVAVDTATLAPVGAIVVGSWPSDLAVSLAGDALYVGHLGTLGVARIDLATFTFDRFVVAPREPYEVEALSGGRLAVIDQDQWTTPTLIDPSTGTVLASRSWGAYEGALAATSDGNSLFVGESMLSGSNMFRYDVSAGALTEVGKTTYDRGYGFPYPPRAVVALPDGSAAYYAGFLIDGANLAILRYQQMDPIRSVTPNGLLATSTTKVYRVSDGALLGTLPVAGSVQAVSPDGITLYVSTPGAIVTVDLGAY